MELSLSNYPNTFNYLAQFAIDEHKIRERRPPIVLCWNSLEKKRYFGLGSKEETREIIDELVSTNDTNPLLLSYDLGNCSETITIPFHLIITKPITERVEAILVKETCEYLTWRNKEGTHVEHYQVHQTDYIKHIGFLFTKDGDTYGGNIEFHPKEYKRVLFELLDKLDDVCPSIQWSSILSTDTNYIPLEGCIPNDCVAKIAHEFIFFKTIQIAGDNRNVDLIGIKMKLKPLVNIMRSKYHLPGTQDQVDNIILTTEDIDKIFYSYTKEKGRPSFIKFMIDNYVSANNRELCRQEECPYFHKKHYHRLVVIHNPYTNQTFIVDPFQDYDGIKEIAAILVSDIKFCNSTLLNRL